MSANIGLRLRWGDAYIIVAPREAGDFSVEVTDHVGRPIKDVDPIAYKDALAHLLFSVSELRTQVWRMLGGKLPPGWAKPRK